MVGYSRRWGKVKGGVKSRWGKIGWGKIGAPSKSWKVWEGIIISSIN